MNSGKSIDVERARRDTPGCKNRIHFNNAGAALVPTPVLNAVVEHLNLEAEIGAYEAAEQNKEKIQNTYEAAAKLINCAPDEIALTSSATRAWDMAFYAISFQKGDRILTTQSEYASNGIAYEQVRSKTGAEVEIIPNDKHGQVSVEELEAMIDEKVKLIGITHIPTNGGLVNPAIEIGKIAKQHNILYQLDACQTAGQMPINVQEIGCDILSATGRKYLRGPRGIGFLYVRRGIFKELEPPFLDLYAARWTAIDGYEMRPDAGRFEEWEKPYSLIIGLGVAINYAQELGLDVIWERISLLANELRQQLRKIDGVTVRDLGRVQCGIVSFTCDGKTVDYIYNQLAAHNINITISRAASTLLDMQARGLDAVLRASVHYYNTEEEIELFCKALKAIL